MIINLVEQQLKSAVKHAINTTGNAGQVIRINHGPNVCELIVQIMVGGRAVEFDVAVPYTLIKNSDVDVIRLVANAVQFEINRLA
ncbi:MAG: hypothetical protein ACTSQY_00800 [Candidatus Odinarchaeia archaeon]